MEPLLKLDWRTGNFPIGKFSIARSGAISKTGLALGFCGDSFSASPWGEGVFCNYILVEHVLPKHFFQKQITSELFCEFSIFIKTNFVLWLWGSVRCLRLKETKKFFFLLSGENRGMFAYNNGNL